MLPAIAMLKVIGLGSVSLLGAEVPSFFHETDIQKPQKGIYFGPKVRGVGICGNISLHIDSLDVEEYSLLGAHNGGYLAVLVLLVMKGFGASATGQE